jgi:hypothetical protein
MKIPSVTLEINALLDPSKLVSPPGFEAYTLGGTALPINQELIVAKLDATQLSAWLWTDSEAVAVKTSLATHSSVCVTDYRFLCSHHLLLPTSVEATAGINVGNSVSVDAQVKCSPAVVRYFLTCSNT